MTASTLASGSDDHDVIPVAEIEQRGGPPLAALRPHVVEEQHRRHAQLAARHGRAVHPA